MREEYALELLDNLKESGNTEYLRAILSIRAKDDNKAIQHLLKACELDPTKVYRAPLDPEISQLVSKYGLQDQLDKSGASSEIGLSEEDGTR